MTRKPFFGILALLLILMAVGAQQKPKSADVLMGTAMHQEEVEGNLEAAIATYKNVIAAAGSDRALAAKALVRMGQCYEKLGDAQAREARKAYERVIREFSDQKETVATAQARLAALNHTTNGSSMVVRRVWAGPEVYTLGAVSRDGRYLSCMDVNTYNLALRDLATGETHALTKDSDDSHFPGNSIISPDGKQVAYTWLNKDEVWDLRLVGADGSGQRVLYSNKDLSIDLGAWSPDSARIVAIFTRKDGTSRIIKTNQIVSISVGDGSVRVLKTLDSRWPQPRAFSPDGRYIAYDYPPREDSKNRDIFLLAADGSQEVPLVQHPADDQLLGWAPDGKGVLFASDRTGKMGAWFIQVADGKPYESPELIKSELGNVFPLGFSRSGSFFYGIVFGGPDAYVAKLDPAAARLLTAPARISERFIGTNSAPVFSPDGQYLACFSRRTGSPGMLSGWVLYIRSLKTGEERELSLASEMGNLWDPHWSADGHAILITGAVAPPEGGFYLIDTRTGNVSPLLQCDPNAVTAAGQWTPDGKSIVFWRTVFVDNTRRILQTSCILQRDLATGSEREIYRAPAGAFVTNVALSPDGLEVAFAVHSPEGGKRFFWLGVVSAQGADAHEILRLNGDESIPLVGLVWTPDGQHLLFAKESENTSTLELWRVSPRDKEPQKVGVLGSGAYLWAGLRVHPDGKSIAFNTRRKSEEVWVLENFLPVPKAAKK